MSGYEGFTITLPPQYVQVFRDLVLMLKHVETTRYVPGREEVQVAFTQLVDEEWLENQFFPVVRAAFDGRFPMGTKGLETLKPIPHSSDAYRGHSDVVHADPAGHDAADADGQPYKQIIRDAISMFDNHVPGDVVATYLRDALEEA